MMRRTPVGNHRDSTSICTKPLLPLLPTHFHNQPQTSSHGLLHCIKWIVTRVSQGGQRIVHLFMEQSYDI